MKNKNAIIFDLDGTLTYFKIDYISARQEVINKLILSGIPDSLISVNQRIMDIIKIAENYFNNIIKAPDNLPFIKKEVDDIVTKYEMDGAEKTDLMPGAKELLIILKKNKYKIGLFTLENREVTNYILKKFSIKSYFNSIITRDDVNNPKPHPDHLKMVLKQLNVTSDKTIVVGDNPIDFECAKQLDALTIALMSDRHTKDELLNSGANYAIENLLDILQILDEINL